MQVESQRSHYRVQLVSRIHLPEAAAASFRLDALERALFAAGDRLRVVTARPVTSSDDAHPGLVWLPVHRDSDGYVKGYLSYLSFDLQAFWQVLIGPKADVIVVEPPPTTGFFIRIAATLRRTPYVWYAADVWSDATRIIGAPSLICRLVDWIERFTLQGAARVIAVSEGVAKRVAEISGQNATVARFGADTRIFNPGVKPIGKDALEQVGIKYPFLIYAGTASEWQGAEIFAEAFLRFWRENSGYQLVFLAKGTSLPKLRQIASEGSKEAAAKGLDAEPIILLPTVDADTAARWQKTSVGALCSIVPGCGYDFAYPTKILVALACGVPVLYAGAGPAGGDINSGNLGVSCDYEVDAIATGMREIVNRSWEPQRLFRWVEQYRSLATSANTALQVVHAAAQNPAGGLIDSQYQKDR